MKISKDRLNELWQNSEKIADEKMRDGNFDFSIPLDKKTKKDFNDFVKKSNPKFAKFLATNKK